MYRLVVYFFVSVWYNFSGGIFVPESIITTRLRQLRDKAGVNQDVVAEACDISRVALTRYENGQRVPRAQIAARLADYYGVTVDYILGREEQFTPIEEMTPAEMRAEGLKLVKSLSAKGYEEALQYMKFLKEQENK
jgi:transcriptional regulator with XRE-family HTH domain